ncbi:inorganic pyrophosphatase [Aerococcus urinaehominis]|uniref:inorganic diphosphatase n=1 Tax=Aerococcus urinaehominis TaxID=128944 RepID=A0A109RGE6_9LACT|nr:manganese-dependent inorganic pyrophosphatase [Aerococcus urinaehominis]AMB98679.1 inorganic pyrophosphatase [Aerococcus urinaehominis]SDL98360.1 manganese-dependent inorganic pyrophosphatase [Aerococcus urinaehominis]
MQKILVFGHQNPDTDAITSAISYSYYLSQSNQEVEPEPVALGPVNPETQFALDYFNQPAPRVIETAANEVDLVALVDHNESQQSVSDIKEVSVYSVVDHHRIANFETADPILYVALPVGCTQTVIYQMMKFAGVKPTKEIAGLMIAGIVSDTLLFQSPTTTDQDKKTAEALAEIAEIDLQAFGLDLLKAGANVDDKSALEIAEGDAKSFPMGDYSIRIGQINVVDVADVLKRKDEILAVMQSESIDHSYDAFLLVVTNILTNDSVGLYVGNENLQASFEAAFNTKIDQQTLDLPGVVSRKKQVVPPLTKAIED